MNFDDYKAEAIRRVGDLITSQFSDSVDAARADADALIAQCNDRLEKWTALLASGQIDADDFQWLVEAQQDEIKVTALKNAGITPERVNLLVTATLEILVKVAVASLV